MAFRFPLATVLRYREIVEKREEVALEKVQMEIAQMHRRIEELDQAIAAAQQTREKQLRETISAFQLQAMLDAVKATAEKKAKLHEELRKLEQLRQERLTAYQAAHRGRRMLTDIRGRQKEAFELAADRKQQKMLDDLFAARRQRQ
jgi:flagellar export protein FliJ